MLEEFEEYCRALAKEAEGLRDEDQSRRACDAIALIEEFRQKVKK